MPKEPYSLKHLFFILFFVFIYSLKHEADECTSIPGDWKGHQSFAALSQAECHLDPYIQRDGLETTLSVT